MSRVLSSQKAKNAIRQLQAITDGGLTDQISGLDAQARVLCEPTAWDTHEWGTHETST